MIRNLGKNEGSSELVELIYMTDTFLFPFLFGEIDKAIPKLVKLISMENNRFSYKNIIVCIENGEVKGMLVGFNPVEIKLKKEYIDFSKVLSKTEMISLLFKCCTILRSQGNKKDISGAYIQNISVGENCRGEGIGTKLIEYYSQNMKQQGTNSLFLDVPIENERAKKMYERRGFFTIKKIKIFLSSSGYYRMEKKLV